MYKLTQLCAFIILSSNLFQQMVFAQNNSRDWRGDIAQTDDSRYDPYVDYRDILPEKQAEAIRKTQSNGDRGWEHIL